jgi:hypothetical protein
MMKQEKELFRELNFKGGSVSLVSPRSCLDNGVHLTPNPADGSLRMFHANLQSRPPKTRIPEFLKNCM